MGSKTKKSQCKNCNAVFESRYQVVCPICHCPNVVELPTERSETYTQSQLDAAITAEREREWQPMGTAPKDGTEVLIHVERRAGIRDGIVVGHYMPGGYCIEDHPAIDEGWYFFSGSMFDKASKPIRWMPLPAIRREVKDG